jgi:hypothetical protein
MIAAIKEIAQRLARGKTARDVLVEQLHQAERDRAVHASLREYHSAMEVMLKQRATRVRSNLRVEDSMVRAEAAA